MMATEKSNHAAPVELVGVADDVKNQPTVNQNTPIEDSDLENVQSAAEADAVADFSEENAQLDAEQAGLAIEGEMAEEEAVADVDKNDLSGKSKQDLVEMFATMLENEPVQTLRKRVEAIKIAFYKLHRAELDAARKAFEAENGEQAEDWNPPLLAIGGGEQTPQQCNRDTDENGGNHRFIPFCIVIIQLYHKSYDLSSFV
jgi:hypothetical protein